MRALGGFRKRDNALEVDELTLVGGFIFGPYGLHGFDGFAQHLPASRKRDAVILHPLPRTVELDKTVDDDPRALYFRQAKNGLYVRMALLTMLLDKN